MVVVLVCSNAAYNDLTSVPRQLQLTSQLTHLILWVFLSSTNILGPDSQKFPSQT